MAPHSPRALAVACALLAACGGGSGKAPDDAVDRVEVTPAGFLLTSAGATAQLTARALARDGRVLQAPIAWRSSAPDVVSVDGAGRLLATSDLGSAQIVAEAGGVPSVPVVGVVAAPVPGAVVVPDAQVVGGLTPLDPPEALGLGFRYQVRLAGLPPLAAGSPVVGSGAFPLAGRVVAAEPAGADQLVTLEVVEPGALFERLVVQETIDLSRVTPVVPPGAAPYVGVRRSGLGGWVAEAFPWAAAGLPFGLPNFGPFRCSASLELPAVALDLREVRVEPGIDAVVDYREDRPAGQRLRKIAIAGTLSGELQGELRLGLAPEAKLKCEAELMRIPVPANGFLAWLFGLNVPVGLGIELGDKVSVDAFQVDLRGRVAVAVEVGAQWNAVLGAFEPIGEVSGDLGGSAAPRFTVPSSGTVTFELATATYAIAKLGFGVTLWKDANVEAVELKAGVKGAISWRSRVGQAADPAYRSRFGVAAYWEGEAASSVKWMRDRLELKVFDFKTGQEWPLAGMADGTVAVAPAAVAVGEPATVTVTLRESRYLGQAAVKRVDVTRDRPLAGGGLELVPVCSMVPESGDQKVFTCQHAFGSAEQGDLVLRAFALAEDIGVVLDLEVADDAHAHLRVGAVEPTVFDSILGGLRLGYLDLVREVTGPAPACTGRSEARAMVSLNADGGTWSGRTFTGAWDFEVPPGGFGGHRREQGTLAVTVTPDGQAVESFAAHAVVTGYYDDTVPPGTSTDTLDLAWVGPPIPLAGSGFWRFDYILYPTPLGPGSLTLTNVTTSTFDSCTVSVTSYAGAPDGAGVKVGLSPAP